MPAVSLLKLANRCPGSMQTSSLAFETSTPQIVFFTVTCLVHAIGTQATVRSCVTWRRSQSLTHGCSRRGNGRHRHALWPVATGQSAKSLPSHKFWPCRYKGVSSPTSGRGSVGSCFPRHLSPIRPEEGTPTPALPENGEGEAGEQSRNPIERPRRSLAPRNRVPISHACTADRRRW